MRQLHWVYCIIICFPFLLMAQKTPINILYLKNGSTVRGHILEMKPDSIVKLQLQDGRVLLYPIKKIDHIAMVSLTEKMVPKNQETLKKSNTENCPSSHEVGIYSGMAFPLGDFASESKADAAAGITFGFQVSPKALKGFLFDINYTYNGLSHQNAGHWTSVTLLAGYSVTVIKKGSVKINLTPLLGTSCTSTPPITISSSSEYEVFYGKSSFAIAYGIQMKTQVSSQWFAFVRLVGCKPRFKFNFNEDIYTYSQSILQMRFAVGVNL